MKKNAFAIQMRLAIFSFAVVLLSVTGAIAAPTTPEDAKKVVINWLRAEATPMNAALGGQVGKVETFADVHVSPAYYVVFLNPAGLVFVPADDSVEPIICFVSGATSYDPSPSNLLGAIMGGDIPGRVLKARDLEAGAGPDAPFPAPGSIWEKARRKWDQLKGAAPQAASGLAGISDVYVAPLVQTAWSEAGADETYYPTKHPCYNYYTPPNAPGDPNNYYSGDVATAMAQVMKYHQWPQTGVGTQSFQIQVNGAAQSRSLRGGDGAGGPYQWANMPLTTSSSTPVAACQAIGALTADAGVALGTDYSEAVGCASPFASTAFYDPFGYAAIDAYNNGDMIPLDNLYAMVNPDLDAGLPVILHVTGTGGNHSAVCDGYGYNNSTLYHHLNMGWLGQYNAWYNLPNVVAYYNFGAGIYAASYNIRAPGVYGYGDATVVSGRVTDTNGNPLGQVSVTGIQNPAGASQFTGSTNDRGIYSFGPVDPGVSVTITVSKEGYTFTAAQVATTGSNTPMTPNTGNVWGVNFIGNEVDSATHFKVTPSSTSVLAGAQFYCTVAALDAKNATVSNYPGTVHLTSTDKAAVLPSDSTLSNGTGKFFVTLNTAGSWTVTAKDINTPSITGQSGPIKVKALSISGTVETYQGKPFAGVAMTLSNDQKTTTNSAGKYGFSNLPVGVYTVTPSEPGDAFQPSSATLTLTNANAANVNFKATK